MFFEKVCLHNRKMAASTRSESELKLHGRFRRFLLEFFMLYSSNAEYWLSVMKEKDMKRNPKMNRMTVLRSAISYLIAAAMLTVSLPTSSAVAGMIPTDRVIELASAEKPRERVMEFLGREDIRRQMEAMGVDPGEAAVRVDSLSAAEVAQIAGRIEQLPAGQDAATAVIGAALVIFIVLLITDILGYTDVLPFVTPAE